MGQSMQRRQIQGGLSKFRANAPNNAKNRWKRAKTESYKVIKHKLTPTSPMDHG